VSASLDGVQSFSVEPILDIRQQAEFFVSLGQTDRALHILKKQIDGASQPNPLIFPGPADTSAFTGAQAGFS
jgi:hypothetical protein